MEKRNIIRLCQKGYKKNSVLAQQFITVPATLSCVQHLHARESTLRSSVCPTLNCINLQRANVPTLAYLLKDNAVLSGERSATVGFGRNWSSRHNMQEIHPLLSKQYYNEGIQHVFPAELGRLWSSNRITSRVWKKAARFDEAGVLKGLYWHLFLTAFGCTSCFRN